MPRTILLVVALVLAGCTADTSAPTPQIIYVTPAPTATPDPTPAPTPAPTPEPVLASKWLEFLAWGAVSLIECDPKPLQYAMQAYDDLTAYVEAESLGRCYRSNLDWLDAHPPLPCYQGIWTKTRDFFSNAKQATGLASRFWYEYPYGNVSDLQSAVTYLERGTASLGAASDEMDRSKADAGFCMLTVVTNG